jgi:hypothetical protein
MLVRRLSNPEWTSHPPGGLMPSRSFLGLFAAVALAGATIAPAVNEASTPADPSVLRVTSGTAGHSVPFRAVLLRSGQPMRVVEETTPFELPSAAELTFAAFEALEPAATLRLELVSLTPERAVVIAPRVMIGRRIGGVAAEFVQGY